ncbi:MAG: ribose-phosphate pyrophosphokinase [Dehalococcoidia bacterium]|nr:ribose-phosphate pyrophosphokinase [Dehalococcoidia bacterium]
MRIFTGSTHPALALEVCDYLKIPPGKSEVFKFSNENTFVRVLENVRGRDVFIIQPTSSPVNDSLMELLIFIDTVKRASADRITAVIPYYGYGRSDKKDQPRVPITARLVADLITTAGADRVLTMDLHAGQIQGFFNIPVDELTALYSLRDYFRNKGWGNLTVVATDIGISKRARDLAHMLNSPLAIIEKRRLGNNDNTETLNVIGDVSGRRVLTMDDEIDTAGSLVSAALALNELGASEIYSCCTHPIFSGSAIERIASCPVKEVVVTNTVPLLGERQLEKIIVLSVAPLIGEAIYRIHTGQSIGTMFK